MHTLKILGSADASGAPNPFCNCAWCERARHLGGKHVRTRAGARLDDLLHFDLAPDLLKQALDNKLCLADLEHIFITHYHADHFAVGEMELMLMAKVDRRANPLNVYLSKDAHAEFLLSPFWRYGELNQMIDKGMLKIHIFDPEMGVKLPGYHLKAIFGNHKGSGISGRALNYLATGDDKKVLLYATDTGAYHEEQFEALSGIYLSALVLECTFTDDRDVPMGGHHDIPNFIRTLESFKALGNIDEKTKVVMTHIGHHHLKYDHDTLAQRINELAPMPVTVGYDGLDVTY